VPERNTEMNKIALLPVKGPVVSEELPLSAFTVRIVSVRETIRLLEKIKKSKRIKAVVLEINSPGGSPLPCKEIAEAIKSVGRPTVAWVREVAASGGYWIASATDVIVADSLSTVGSVGVASIRPDFSEFLKKLGVDMDTVASGIHKLFGLPFRPLSSQEKQEDRKRREQEISIIQQIFLNGIKEKRQLKAEAVQDISSGKTYLGQEAKDLGLIDELGGRQKALEIAAKRANITSYKVVDYSKKLERPRRSLGRLFRLLGGP
jgi:protease-4